MALTFLVANGAQYLIIIGCGAGCLVQQRSHIEQVLDCCSIRSIQALDVELDPCFGEHALCYRLQKQDPICLSCDVIRNQGSWIIPITGIIVYAAAVSWQSSVLERRSTSETTNTGNLLPAQSWGA